MSVVCSAVTDNDGVAEGVVGAALKLVVGGDLPAVCACFSGYVAALRYGYMGCAATAQNEIALSCCPVTTSPAVPPALT